MMADCTTHTVTPASRINHLDIPSGPETGESPNTLPLSLEAKPVTGTLSLESARKTN
jgi:hypothetical protein